MYNKKNTKVKTR